MPVKAKATIALRKELLEVVDQESRKRHETRSAIIEEAIALWQRQRLENALAQGYQAMATEDQSMAERHLRLAREILS